MNLFCFLRKEALVTSFTSRFLLKYSTGQKPAWLGVKMGDRMNPMNSRTSRTCRGNFKVHKKRATAKAAKASGDERWRRWRSVSSLRQSSCFSLLNIQLLLSWTVIISDCSEDPGVSFAPQQHVVTLDIMDCAGEDVRLTFVFSSWCNIAQASSIA